MFCGEAERSGWSQILSDNGPRGNLKSQFIEHVSNNLAEWRTVLRRPVSWPLMAVAAYVFLAPNVDFAEKLAWHDGQRIAQLAVISLVVLVLTASRAKVAFAGAWADLPRWSRWTLGVVFTLAIVSAVQAPLPRWAMLEWGMSVLLLTTALSVAAARRQFGESMDKLLVLLLFSTALAYAVTTSGVYLLMLLHPSSSSHFATCSIVKIWLCLWHIWPTPKSIEVLFAVVASIISAMTRGTYSFCVGFFNSAY